MPTAVASKFINSALIHSRVLPLAQYNFGLNLQWQPLDEWYAMAGGSMGDAQAGYAPWTDFSAKTGLCPWKSATRRGTCLALVPAFTASSHLRPKRTAPPAADCASTSSSNWVRDSPLGWFGRFGFGGEKVSGGAPSQIGTGFVFQGPFKHMLLQRTSNDLLGVGFVWSEPSITRPKKFITRTNTRWRRSMPCN